MSSMAPCLPTKRPKKALPPQKSSPDKTPLSTTSPSQASSTPIRKLPLPASPKKRLKNSASPSKQGSFPSRLIHAQNVQEKKKDLSKSSPMPQPIKFSAFTSSAPTPLSSLPK